MAGVVLGNALAEFAEHLCTMAGLPVKRLTGCVAAASAEAEFVLFLMCFWKPRVDPRHSSPLAPRRSMPKPNSCVELVEIAFFLSSVY